MPDGSPLWRRYRDLLRRRPDDDVAEELGFHVTMREAEARRQGLSAGEARAAALERFGDYAEVERELQRIDGARETRRARTEWVGDLRQDIRFAVRSLRRAPSFTLAAALTLALAVGANTAIFSVVDALLLRPLPYAAPRELVSTWGWSLGELVALRERAHGALAAIAAYRTRGAAVDNGSDAVQVEGAAVTANFFALLGTEARLGRPFSADEGDRGKPAVVVLSHQLWLQRFAGDSAVVGRRIVLDGAPATVIGVMPEGFHFPTPTTQFWTPVTIDRADVVAMWTIGYRFLGRLQSHATVAGARAQFRELAPQLRHSNPMWDPGPGYGKDADVRPLQDTMVGGARSTLTLLSGCVLLVLLIACVNVANLLLARASVRGPELAVRAALGGGRGRIVRQLLTESIVLAALGGTLGLGVGVAGVRWLAATLPPGIRASEIGVNGPVLAFTAALVVLTGLTFGVVPALRATAPSGGADAVRAGRGGLGVGHHRLSGLLVAAEMALAVMLVAGATLFVRGFRALRRAETGFTVTHVMTARVNPPAGNYRERERVTALYDGIFEGAAMLPTVESVAGVSALPIAGPVYGIALRIEGQFEDVKRGLPMADHFQIVTPTYFRTLRIPIVGGRAFTAADRADQPPVAVVSAATARHFWPNQEAIGKRIGYPYPGPWLTIVGVVADVKQDSLRDTAAMSVYMPFAQRERIGALDMTVVVRSSGDPTAVAGALRAIVARIDRGVPVDGVQSMDEVVARSVAKPRFAMLLVSLFAGLAFALGGVGIYGVMSYLVSQRSREIGVRVALGATSGDIARMVLSRGAGLAGSGALIGLGAAFVLAPSLRAAMYGAASPDALTIVGVFASLLLLALVASYLPARRAARVDPVAALRGD